MDKKKSLALLDYYAEVEREIRGLDATFLDLLKTRRGRRPFKNQDKNEKNGRQRLCCSCSR